MVIFIGDEFLNNCIERFYCTIVSKIGIWCDYRSESDESGKMIFSLYLEILKKFEIIGTIFVATDTPLILGN